MSSKTFWIIAILIIGLGSLYWFVFNNDETSKSSEAQNTEEAVNEISVKDQIINEFTERYQPNIEIGLNKISYTFQLENQLVKTGKPIIFTAALDDIFTKENETYMRFAPAFLDFSEPQLYFTLNGCDNKVDEIVNREKSFFAEYVVVAEIDNIEKPIAQVRGIATGEYDIELELAQSDIYLATGTCVDLAYIEDSTLDNLFDDL